MKNPLYTRTETEKEIQIVFKPYSKYFVYLYVLAAILFFATPNEYNPYILNVTLAILFIFLILRMGVLIETNKAMKTKFIKVKGNGYSSKNPLTYIIPKETL